MRRLVAVGWVVVVALVLAGSPGPASATTVCVGGTITAPCTDGHPGGAFALTSNNAFVDFHGGASMGFSCSDSSISGVAPATAATTVSIPVTLSYSGCTVGGFNFPSVTVPVACQDRITMNVMYAQAAAPQAKVALTIPSGCTITVISPFTCTFTIGGEQTIGAASGISWTNGSVSSASSLELSSALVSPVTVHGPGMPGCSTPGTTSMTLFGTYRVTSPSPFPGMTVIP